MRIILNDNPMTGFVEFYIVTDPDRDGYVSHVKPVFFEVIKELVPGEKVEPTFRLSRAAVDGLAEQLDKLHIKTDKDAKIEGTLEATRYHLEDLRTILKIKR